MIEWKKQDRGGIDAMKILAVMPFKENHRAVLEKTAKESGSDCSFVYKPIADVKEEDVRDADIILGNVKPELVAKADGLQWIQLNSAGAEAYAKADIVHEAMLTNARGAYGLSVSEWMMAATFMLCRKMDLYMRHEVDHAWQDEGRVTSIWGSVTLVLGLGNIGSDYAGRMKAMGSHVIGLTRHKRSVCPECADEIDTIDHLDDYLPRADFVVMILPGTKENVGLMDMPHFSLMKKSAYLINAGRGNAVKSMDLNQALREGVIAGAALDVTDPEPLPADHPLWDAPRCIITPHIAGKFHLEETFERIVRLTDHNLAAFLAGRRQNAGSPDFSDGRTAGDGRGMYNIIDPAKGY